MIHRLRFGAPDCTGRVELELPSSGPARYSLELTGTAIGAGFVIVTDDAIARPRGSVLEVRADGLWTEMICETPGEHWSFGLEAFGLRVDDPVEVVGERLAVGYDLEWEAPDRVHGEILLARATIPVDARGTFEILAGP